MGGGFTHPWNLFKANASEHSDQPAFYSLCWGKSKFSHFQSMTWAEAYLWLTRFAQMLKLQNLNPGDRIGLHGRNSVEWILADWAIVSLGYVSVPLYLQSSESEIIYIQTESEMSFIFVDEKISFLKTRQIRFSDLVAQSESLSGIDLDSFRDEKLISRIIYTSGTSGHPKGVMHSLRNGYLAASTAISHVRMTKNDRLLSYLPLSHVAEHALIQWGGLYCGAPVYVVDRVERIAQLLPLVKPTLFFAVPRIWEILRFKIEKQISQKFWTSIIPRRLLYFFLRLVVRKSLGLQATRLCVSGAAKLNTETQYFLGSVGIHISEAYGLTETMGVTSINLAPKENPGSIGQVFPGIEIKCLDDGELLVKSPFNFLGYYKQEGLTQAAWNQDWFLTGDIARISPDGFITITDRKKNIFKSSSGKYIAPQPIEIKLKSHPAIEEAIVVGESRPHCVALISIGSVNSITTPEIQALLKSVNQTLPHHEQIKTIGCLIGSWGTESGEMTATYKVKRKVILNRYESHISELYESTQPVRYFM